MNYLIKHRGQKILSWVLFSAFLFLATSAAFAGESGESICSRAFNRCAGDALWAGLFSGMQSFITYMGACIVGYDFCVRYIQSYL
jgi:hypothetical protein